MIPLVACDNAGASEVVPIVFLSLFGFFIAADAAVNGYSLFKALATTPTNA